MSTEKSFVWDDVFYGARSKHIYVAKFAKPSGSKEKYLREGETWGYGICCLVFLNIRTLHFTSKVKKGFSARILMASEERGKGLAS